jgi:hypothetical protein
MANPVEMASPEAHAPSRRSCVCSLDKDQCCARRVQAETSSGDGLEVRHGWNYFIAGADKGGPT